MLKELSITKIRELLGDEKLIIKDKIIVILGQSIEDRIFTNMCKKLAELDTNFILVRHYYHLNVNLNESNIRSKWIEILPSNSLLERVLSNCSIKFTCDKKSNTIKHAVICSSYVLNKQHLYYLQDRLSLALGRTITLKQKVLKQTSNTSLLNFISNFFEPITNQNLNQAWPLLVKYCQQKCKEAKNIPYEIKQITSFFTYVDYVTDSGKDSYLLLTSSLHKKTIKRFNDYFQQTTSQLLSFLTQNPKLKVKLQFNKLNTMQDYPQSLQDILITIQELEDTQIDLKTFLSLSIRKNAVLYQDIIKKCEFDINGPNIVIKSRIPIDKKILIFKERYLECAINFWFWFKDPHNFKRLSLKFKDIDLPHNDSLNIEFSRDNVDSFIEALKQCKTNYFSQKWVTCIESLSISDINFMDYHQVHILVREDLRMSFEDVYTLEAMINSLIGVEYHNKIVSVGPHLPHQDVYFKKIWRMMFKHTILRPFYEKSQLYHYDPKKRSCIFFLSVRSWQFMLTNRILVDKISQSTFEFFLGHKLSVVYAPLPMSL